MSHFSAEQIARWAAGERTPEEEQHVRECHACAAEIQEFAAVLAGFGAHVKSVAEAHSVPAWRKPRAASVVWLRLGLAAAVVAVVATIPVYKARERAAEITQADALLQQVDAGISRAIPQPMEPLVDLGSWAQEKSK